MFIINKKYMSLDLRPIVRLPSEPVVLKLQYVYQWLYTVYFMWFTSRFFDEILNNHSLI